MKVASDVLNIPRYVRLLRLVCSGEFTVYVVLVRTGTCQRSHHDVMPKIGNPDAEGLERADTEDMTERR
jgi:hypothetical protein